MGILVHHHLPLMFISDVFFPLDGAPAWLQRRRAAFPVPPSPTALQVAFDPRTNGAGHRRRRPARARDLDARRRCDHAAVPATAREPRLSRMDDDSDDDLLRERRRLAARRCGGRHAAACSRSSGSRSRSPSLATSSPSPLRVALVAVGRGRVRRASTCGASWHRAPRRTARASRRPASPLAALAAGAHARATAPSWALLFVYSARGGPPLPERRAAGRRSHRVRRAGARHRRRSADDDGNVVASPRRRSASASC